MAAGAPAASNVCGVKSTPKAARTQAGPGSRPWELWCAGGPHPSRLGLQTARVCWCWDVSPSWGVLGPALGCPSDARSLPAQGGRPFPAWRKKSIFWRMCWPGKRLLAPRRCGTASPGVRACSRRDARGPAAASPGTPACCVLRSCPGAAVLTALPPPAATLVPAGGRQRVADGLRDGFLQRGPASSRAAATLPTPTTAAVQKNPVEASPIPSSDDVVLGETPGTARGRGFRVLAGEAWAGGTVPRGSPGVPLCPAPPGRADRGVHGGRDLGADRGCGLLVQVSRALPVPASPSGSHGSLWHGGVWRRGDSCPFQSLSSPPACAMASGVRHLPVGAGGRRWDALMPGVSRGSWERVAAGLGIAGC